ncbi:MAG TPA: squalene synthase HpnC [Acidimicrobiales bacterium]|nr:squalene synthase HpnC [Acidimicrobiales bacterium]
MTTRSLPYTHTGIPPTGPETAGILPAAAPQTPAGLPGIDAISARARGENFRVASALLPARTRAALMDVYRYARFVDELGDSFDGDRLAALDWLETELWRGLTGGEDLDPAVAGAARLAQLGKITAEPLFRLIEANRLDQQVQRYETFDQLVGYCEFSANPVGRLVLELFELSTPERIDWSDLICTGLQLAEHLQDVAEDAGSGRVYLPNEDLRAFGVEPSELIGGRPASPSLQAMMAFEAGRARGYLDGGAPLIPSVRGRARVAIAGYWAGGHAALDAIERAEFDPLSRPARRSASRVGWHLGRALVAPRRIGSTR